LQPERADGAERGLSLESAREFEGQGRARFDGRARAEPTGLEISMTPERTASRRAFFPGKGRARRACRAAYPA